MKFFLLSKFDFINNIFKIFLYHAFSFYLRGTRLIKSSRFYYRSSYLFNFKLFNYCQILCIFRKYNKKAPRKLETTLISSESIIPSLSIKKMPVLIRKSIKPKQTKLPHDWKTFTIMMKGLKSFFKS
jgi:hypothetical protein